MGWMVPIIVASAQKQQDEKLLAELLSKDKEDKYEFKILRGHLRAFRKSSNSTKSASSSAGHAARRPTTP